MSDGTDHDECRRSIGDGIRKLKAATAALTEANATIAALREALQTVYDDWCMYASETDDVAGAIEQVALDAIAQPLPPAAAKLLAERDAGRALFEAVRESGGSYDDAVWQAVEAYRRGVEA